MPLYTQDDKPFDETQLFPEVDPISLESVKVGEPGFGEVLEGAFRLENEVVSTFADKTRSLDPYENDGYDAWSDIQGTEFEDNWEQFADVYNTRYANALKSQILREKEDRRNIQAGGASGIAASIAAGIISPTTLLPGGVIVKGARGASVARTALSTAAATSASVGVQESLLQRSQRTRTASESAFAIGTSALVGGMLGGLLARVVGKAEVDRIVNNIDGQVVKSLDEPDVDDFADAYKAVIDNDGNLSAAATPKVQAGDIQFANKVQEKLSKVAFYNPMIGLLNSRSATAKSVVARLPEMGFAMKMTGEAKGLVGPAAETAVKRWTQGAVGRAMTSMSDNFSTFRKAGGKLNNTEFRERVGRAMRRGDVDEDQFVSKVAEKFRKEVFDPLKEQAIKLDMLPEDVAPETAVSYFSRMYNRPKIIARQRQFKEITQQWARRAFAEDFQIQRLEPQEIDFYTAEIAEDIYRKITGVRTAEDPFLRTLTMTSRGPLKERTFTIEDELIEEFLEDDVELVARRYARIMGADVELTRRFGRADLDDVFSELADDYRGLRDDVEAQDIPQDKKEKALTQLSKEQNRDLAYIEGLRDRLRGVHKLEENTSNVGRMIEGINTFNYLRTMGGVTVSSISDVARHIMTHGPVRFMNEGIAPLVTNLKGIKISAAQAREMGAAAELINHSRMATLADLTDPYAFGNPVERWLRNAGTGFSRLALMEHWNQAQKSMASVLSQNRILKNAQKVADKGYDALSKTEKRYMEFVGINPENADAIGRLYKAHGQKEGPTFIGNPQRWIANEAEERARSVFESAVIKDVDGTIVTKGIGDTPLALDGPVARSIFQFKSFMLASHQRMLMRAVGGTEEAQAVASGMMVAIGMGMFTYWLKSIESGRDVSDNPGKWIAEGIDRSGLFAVLMEMNNVSEKVGLPGFYQAMSAAFPDHDQSPPASRYAIRSTPGALLGPTFGLATDAAQLAGVAAKAANPFGDDFGELDYTKGDVAAARRLTPGSTLPGVRSMLEYLVLPELEEGAR